MGLKKREKTRLRNKSFCYVLQNSIIQKIIKLSFFNFQISLRGSEPRDILELDARYFTLVSFLQQECFRARDSNRTIPMIDSF